MPTCVLVTGGAGFIGSNLIYRLISEDINVVCLDNFDLFYSSQIKKENIAPFIKSKKFLFVRGTVLDIALLERVFKTYKICKVIHLAARPGVSYSIKNPSLYEKINVCGTLNLLKASCNYDVKSFVFASSSSVYGEAKNKPSKEDDPLQPLSPYGATKISGENYCRALSKFDGLNSICLRFFTVYGPRQRPDMAIHKFTEFIQSGKPITLYGRGTVRRDFTFVSDVVEAIVRSLKKRCSCETFNVGNSDPVTLNRLVFLLEKELGRKAKVNYKPLPKCESALSWADISKADEKLGFRPKVDIEKGIVKFVNWYLDKGANNEKIAIHI